MLKHRALLILMLSWVALTEGCAVGQLGSLFGGLGQAGGGAAGGPLAGPISAPLPAAPPKGQAATPDPAALAGGKGAACDNVAACDASGMLQGGGQANDGRLTFTQYGGPTDHTPDGNTASGLGNRGNRLRPTSLALAPNLIREYGLKGGEEIYLKANGRTVFLGNYDDTTGSSARQNVIDVYDPQDRLGKDNFMRTVAAGQWELQIGQASA